MTQHGRHNARSGTPPDDAADETAADGVATGDTVDSPVDSPAEAGSVTEEIALDSDEDSLPDEVDAAPLGDHRSFFDSDIPVGDEPLR